mmetsp:Transcript_30939/g.49798  ORF Transcript_30939/g.49798 Transcript_30939/m.49798 type:complete len:261 (-) Transcript_30939:80-862(-)
MAPLSSPATSTQATKIYEVFVAIAALVYFTIAECSFSSILTMAGMSQCLSLVFLARHDSVQGISALSLVLQILHLACRLSSTVWLNGYLPYDATGDWLYQSVDAISLFLALGILVRFMVAASDCRREKLSEAWLAVPVFCVCLTLGVSLHSNMDKRPLFDALWMAGVLLSSAATIAQFSALSKTSSLAKDDGAQLLPGHALAAATLSHIFSVIYMWHARNDMRCDEWVEGFNHASWLVLAAHVMPLLFVCDFMQECDRDA